MGRAAVSGKRGGTFLCVISFWCWACGQPLVRAQPYLGCAVGSGGRVASRWGHSAPPRLICLCPSSASPPTPTWEVGLLACFFFHNSFMEICFTYHPSLPFKVYNSVLLLLLFLEYPQNCASITTVHFRTFSLPPRINLAGLSCHLPVPPSSQALRNYSC